MGTVIVEQSARRSVAHIKSYCFKYLKRILRPELLVIRLLADKYHPSRALSNAQTQLRDTFRPRIVLTGRVLWRFHQHSPDRARHPSTGGSLCAWVRSRSRCRERRLKSLPDQISSLATHISAKREHLLSCSVQSICRRS